MSRPTIHRLLALICLVTMLGVTAACASGGSAPAPAAQKPAEAPKQEAPKAAAPTQAPAPAPTQAPAAAPKATEAPKAAAPTQAPAAAPKATEAPKAAAPAAAGAVPANKTFTIAWTATDVTTFDPHLANSTDATTFVRNVYDSLVGYKYGTTEIEGVLAKEWKVSDDGKTWTITLKDEAKFADGSPVTAEDVVYSFDRLNALGKGPAYVISGNYDGAQATGPKTAVLKLKRGLGTFLYMLPRVFIVNSKAVKAKATDADKWAEKWLYDNTAGSGPYMMDKWEHGVQASVIRNPNYWGTAPTIERMVSRQIPERATDRLLLEKGEVDTVLNAVLDVMPAYKSNKDLQVVEIESLISMQIMMSQTAKPLNDVRVRKAVALAFDYQAMVDGVYQGFATQARGPIPRNMQYHNDKLPVLKKDIAEAKKLLAEAGFPNGGFELEIFIVQGQQFGIGASQILQQGLKELGINLKVTQLAFATLAGRIAQKDNPAHMYTWYTFPAYPDPDAVLWPFFHSSQQGTGQNMIWYNDPKTDEALEKARFSNDQKEREQIYKDLQQKFFDTYPAIWLVNPKNIGVFRSWVKNYKYDPTWHQTYRVSQYTLEGKP